MSCRASASRTAGTGVSVQVIADPTGRLIWASPALPGATHDLSAPRTYTITDNLASANVMNFADRGYQRRAGRLRSRGQQRVPRRHQQILQKRCGFGFLATVFPGITATTYGVATAPMATSW
ncbi:hypothetical protein B0E53_03255 [Micromonospora sp. MH33]|nr:hypothetical protein B0E53_03255 [Micromonospora sp. MH33]